MLFSTREQRSRKTNCINGSWIPSCCEVIQRGGSYLTPVKICIPLQDRSHLRNINDMCPPSFCNISRSPTIPLQTDGLAC